MYGIEKSETKFINLSQFQTSTKGVTPILNGVGMKAKMLFTIWIKGDNREG